MNQQQYISLRNLDFSFTGADQLFFKDITIDFNQGKLNFICGKNGMGKSTLLNILSGNAQYGYVQGVLSIDRQDYPLQSLHLHNRMIALVSQNFSSMLIDVYSFEQNMQCAQLKQYPSCAFLPAVAPIPVFVEKYGIQTDIPIHLLSGGQRQILSILMMVQRSPKILLLDEPTAALDEENADLVMQFLQDVCVQENITVIMIVHNLELVEKYAAQNYFQLYQDDGARRVRKVIFS